MINIEKFKSDCNKGKCNRSTMKSKQCLKDYKQEQCFKKYNNQLNRNKEKIIKLNEKNQEKYKEKKVEQELKTEEYRQNCARGIYPEQEIDEEWERVKSEVWMRDKTCRLWKILNEEEKNWLRENDPNVLYFNKIIGVAHVISRNRSTNLYYESNNLYLLGWGFHFRLDNFRNPLTNEEITKEEIKQWWIRIIGKELYEWLEENNK